TDRYTHSLHDALPISSKEAVLSLVKAEPRGRRASSAALRMEVAGARAASAIEPTDLQPGISNYYIGKDPAKWQTNVPQYGRVNRSEEHTSELQSLRHL